jgi:ABC-2 type transport system ATP-binding protein
LLLLENIKKNYGQFTAVKNLSIKLNEGEFYGFLGPNGAGKTTTIKMMVGLLKPTSGKMSLNGISLMDNTLEGKKIIGYVPDQPFLYDKLTGKEFLYFSGGLYDIPKKELKNKIDELVTLLKIDSWIDKRTEDYSQGMKQRIAIASALLHDPKLIVIDEPMVGLDPQSAFIVKQLLTKKAAEGVTIFMSTHILQIAEELCTKIAIIKDGEKIFEDSREGLLRFKEHHEASFESLFFELTK